MAEEVEDLARIEFTDFSGERLILEEVTKDSGLAGSLWGITKPETGDLGIWVLLEAEQESQLLAWLQARAARREKAGATS